MQHIKPGTTLLRFLYVQKIARKYRSIAWYTTTVDLVDHFTTDSPQKSILKEKNYFPNDFSLRHFMKLYNTKNIEIANMTTDEIDNYLQDLLTKNNNQQIQSVLKECTDKRKFISEFTLKKIYRHFSILGKVNTVELLQQYCQKLDPRLYKQNGEFLHYVAKAECMRGNSEKGLSVLKLAYIKYEGLRNFYRIIFRELINDSINNRSEASLVVFKKYVLDFSKTWDENYPLICFWHSLWCSSWFSDQMLSNELLETCPILQDIVRDKATIFSINFLKEYNEDAVVRLLQSLLKYDMMIEYSKVLQILFGYKLKQRDLRGCTEIIKNCEVLNISLPSNQQGKYIQMLIRNKYTEKPKDAPKIAGKNFKMKF
ncbi:hypothetical protein KGM_202938 [Danaus plexippus plexippus]|uniref:Uncharacterized protein n=1 Tax=Danaus plexippus plexippus TaxID=278856 RepID=A0A212EYP2_DANPL|nr:hypothetical protein KGM_202938 [Danaus plexippus plexippus]